MSESVSVLCVSAVLLSAHRVLVGEHRDVRSMVVLGGLCGLATLARSELALFVPILAVMVIVMVPDRPAMPHRPMSRRSANGWSAQECSSRPRSRC